jgi:hypothetical protein
MNPEKSISNKRSLTGYSSMSVVEHIQKIQEQYQKEINSLKEKLLIEREMNQKLKTEVELQQALPKTNMIEEEIKPLMEDLFEQHLVYTKSILEVQSQLKEQEIKYLQDLDSKKKQKDAANQRLQGALQYFRTPAIIPNEFEKGKY